MFPWRSNPLDDDMLGELSPFSGWALLLYRCAAVFCVLVLKFCMKHKIKEKTITPQLFRFDGFVVVQVCLCVNEADTTVQYKNVLYCTLFLLL